MVHEADAYYGQPQTIPNLEVLAQFPVILWLTGDNKFPDGYFTVSTPLTAIDQQLLANYLDQGGRLLAIGPNVAEASDVNPSDDPAYGRSLLYHGYLGAHWIQGDLITTGSATSCLVAGTSGTWLSSLSVSFPSGDPFLSIDEIGPGGLADGSDADLVQEVMAALKGGTVAVAKSDEPRLEDPDADIPYRTILFSFPAHLSGESCASLHDLLGRAYAWLSDEVTVTLPHEMIGAPGALTSLTVQANSSHGTPLNLFRWSLTGSRQPVVSSSSPTISPIYDQEGSYPLLVEATDDLGHSAIARGTVLIITGGASEFSGIPDRAKIGDLVTYRIVPRNVQAQPITMTVSVAIPEGTVYESHLGGNFGNDVWSWTGRLDADSSFTGELTVRIVEGLQAGEDIIAVAQFTAREQAAQNVERTFQRTVHTRILATGFLPLLFKGSTS
ncbi:MAG: hypothetical protein H5T69_14400 [Chloroflexi bacterium]|nr:hypothetical protein [Chloroflexota bacterium]